MRCWFRICNSEVLLSLVLIAMVASAQAKDSKAQSAQQVMARAHRARAQWKGFPGFEAEVVLQSNHRRLVRQVVVTAELRVQWNEPVPLEFVPLKRRFESVIQHRAAAQQDHYDVEFVPEKGEHPLGRLIRFRHDPMHSRYRIREDLIAQVSRDAGPLHFTISVLDASRNAQGKYLPRIYTISFWDRKTGLLVRSTTVKLQWQRLGQWDLPRAIHSITTQGNHTHRAEVIQLGKLRLRNAPARAAAGAR